MQASVSGRMPQHQRQQQQQQQQHRPAYGNDYLDDTSPTRYSDPDYPDHPTRFAEAQPDYPDHPTRFSRAQPDYPDYPPAANYYGQPSFQAQMSAMNMHPRQQQQRQQQQQQWCDRASHPGHF
jgi:hypothetical protein